MAQFWYILDHKFRNQEKKNGGKNDNNSMCW